MGVHRLELEVAQLMVVVATPGDSVNDRGGSVDGGILVFHCVHQLEIQSLLAKS